MPLRTIVRAMIGERFVVPLFSIPAIVKKDVGIRVFLVLCMAPDDCIWYSDTTNSYLLLLGSIHYPIVVLSALF